MSEMDDRAIESIVQQFRGGEHALAGKRAAQLVHEKGRKPNEAFLKRLADAVPGIERYIAAPDGYVPPIGDSGGNPLTNQPENDPNQDRVSNQSNDQARAEQDEIDDHLAKGREKTEAAAEEADLGNNDVGETRLNPEASSSDDKPAEREKPGE